MCVQFCQLRKQHLDPELYLNGTQIPIIGEAKFLGLLFDSKLSFIPHITSLKSRCTKSLDLIKSGKSECNNSGYKLTGLTWWP